ncbi:Colicin V production protein [Thermosyntropha lipolytica DSM 11003]|uniref:Colicin V production protein n=1 Tax=Thermosyntropha lipolytica DSM 11003 TaxID=1123382 RepID=A0A1M5QX24_9FIRM|nr:CvpA family protein [Thermosyntropha lipolytica]SHH18478.1 Colicin V production protein [Thermosyntropha lipolytica DSM 11003]
MEFNWVDYIILIFLVGSLFAGFKQGFIKALSGIIGLAAGLILAWAYYDNLALYMEDYYGVITLMADFLRERLFLTALPAAGIGEGVPFLPGRQEADIAYSLASFLLLALSFMVLLIIGSRVVRFLWSYLDIIFMTGFWAGLNRLAGMMVVLLKNVVILAVAFVFLTPFVRYGAALGIGSLLLLEQGIDNSYLANIIFKAFNTLNLLKERWFLKG